LDSLLGHTGRSLKLRLGAVAAALVGSVVVYALLFRQANFAAGAAVLVPTIMAGQFFGARGGLPTALLAAASINAVALVLRGFVLQESALGLLLTLGIGAIAGRLEDQRRAVERSQREKRDADARARLATSERLASLGTLAAGIAHEVNNPICFVKGNLDFALGEHARGAAQSGEVRDALADAAKGCGRIAELVEDMRRLARGGDSDPPVAVELDKVARSAANVAAGQVRGRAVLEMDLREIPPVAAVESRLGQVVLNLLVNAAQAMPEARPPAQNRICLRTFTDERGWAVLEVEDNGTGIPEALAPRIFDPFFTTKPVGVGTGLGLALCHSIVSDFGGELGFHSAGVEGTVFRMALPPQAAPRPA
jgi:C4-dicarboxylate-specific signal transduction histidine kinase